MVLQNTYNIYRSQNQNTRLLKAKYNPVFLSISFGFSCSQSNILIACLVFVNRSLQMKQFVLTFKRVKKDGMRLFCVGVVKKYKCFSSCFSQFKAGKENNQSGNEKSKRTTRVPRERHVGRRERKK